MTKLEQGASEWILTAFVCVVLSANGYAQNVQKLSDGSIILENFQQDPVGQLPKGWYDRNGDEQVAKQDSSIQAKYKYKVLQEGDNKFLRYDGMKAMHLNFPFIDKQKHNLYDINIYKTPVLSWKWRVFKLPKNGDENDDSRNDVAASIYVVFDFGHVLFKKVPKSIRYTWSSTLPKGTKLSKFFGNQKIIVVKSGDKDTGQWITFKRNIVQDYENLFGDKPPKTPMAILILSDGDSTGSIVKADYDDIILEPASE